ncbi:MAG TPA: HupE/UreJ family protein [Vicinamibacterales bacterium]|nr:HupE/UreJ family protein [Vicinamibacterales bacterium]
MTLSSGVPTAWLRVRTVLVLTTFLAAARGTSAHPAPFSYLDVRVQPDGLSGRLVVHAIDVAHELNLASPEILADPAIVHQYSSSLVAVLAERLVLLADGGTLPWSMTGAQPVPGEDAVEVRWRATAPKVPGRLVVQAHLFPYDPVHQTFVNLYEGSSLVWQEVLNRDRSHTVFYTGTRQGRLAVFQSFTASGVHHIAIGPDHILFIIGLLLLGGSLTRLLGIVTAFTVGHSLTLALATLNLVVPPARLVEPAIALSIVYVGADNLLVGTRSRDVRAWIALAFGLVHGFGFASVLRETGLPPRALGLSLFAFNLGVEIGQGVIVVLVAAALNILRHRNSTLARRVVTVGSLIVMAAGAFWFVERVFA